jgi:hypothetical protein
MRISTDIDTIRYAAVIPHRPAIAARAQGNCQYAFADLNNKRQKVMAYGKKPNRPSSAKSDNGVLWESYPGGKP